MNIKLLLYLLCITSLLSACPKPFASHRPDGPSLYSNAFKLDEDAIVKRDTSVDLSKFRFVYLETVTTFYPGKFSFYVRQHLSEMGMRNILNHDEMAALVEGNPELTPFSSLGTPMALKQLSNLVGPILKVTMKLDLPTISSRDIFVEITDLSSGKTLLEIHHRTAVLLYDAQDEVYYPVFNAINAWLIETRKFGGSLPA